MNANEMNEIPAIQIPWDVTVAEIEDWLPIHSLAPIEACVLAVHILCNRWARCLPFQQPHIT